MATTQLQRTQGKTVSWEAIFPNEQVTEQKSALFVKKLLAVAISNITYLRAIFPEHAFGDKCLEDLNLKILRDESSCPGACQVIKWVKGCFDALDKKYLRTLVIGIYVDPNNPATVIESYTFKFTYNNSGEVDIYRNNKKISSAHSAEETKKATVRLLRTLIILTNTLTSLPDNVMMTMKLLYYDEVTPADYEPPGFKASNDEAFIFAEDATNIAIGEVATPFHVVKMRVKTGSKQFEMHEDPIEEMEQVAEPGLSINNAGLDYEASGTCQLVQEMACNKDSSEPVTIIAAEPEQTNSNLNQGSVENSEKSNNADDFQVRCPCGCNEDDGLMIMCSSCMFWQHGICFLITSEEAAPTNHICDVCAKQGNSKAVATDAYLCGLSSIAVQATCLWRRALSACMEFKRVVAPQMAKRLGIENTVAQGLINRLEKEGFISTSKKGKKLGRIVNKEKIESEGVPRYLKTSSRLPKIMETVNDVDTDTQMEVQTSVRGSKQQSVTKENKSDKCVDALVEKTNKINIHGRKRVTRSSPGQNKTAISSSVSGNTTDRRGMKRAFSRRDSNEFEVTDSQEMITAKKKTSTVTKDITV